MKFDTLEEIIDSMNRESIFLNFDEDLKSILVLCNLFYGLQGSRIIIPENVVNREYDRLHSRNWELDFD